MKSNLKYVLFCARLADFSYNDPKRNAKHIEIEGVKYNYIFLDQDGAQAYILSDDKNIYVVIRGSSEKEDFGRSFNITYKKDKIIQEKIHRGFLKHSDEIYTDIRKELKLNGKNKEIHIIGHSLGGAMAKIISLRLAMKLNCITFGEPCSFKSYSINTEGKRFLRVVNNRDIICRIPPFFNHGVQIEEEYYFDSKGTLIINPSKYKKRLDIILGRFDWIFGLFGKIKVLLMIAEGIDDHLIKSYIEIIEKELKRL